MRITPFFAVLTAVLLLQPANAHNNFFLPGDAFFSVSITRDLIKQWSESDSTEFDFKYSRFDGDFETDGALGYPNLKLQGINETFKDSLTKAYWRYTALNRPVYRLESDDREDYTQINGVVALIYSKHYTGSLGLKLNENWQIEGLRKYSGLFQAAKPVVEDWRLGPERLPLQLAKAVPPLAHIPLDGEDRLAMKTPVLADLSEIKIVLVGFASQDGFEEKQTCPNLQDIYDNVPGTEYIEVDAKGFTLFSCDEKGKWSEKRTDAR